MDAGAVAFVLQILTAGLVQVSYRQVLVVAVGSVVVVVVAVVRVGAGPFLVGV